MKRYLAILLPYRWYSLRRRMARLRPRKSKEILRLVQNIPLPTQGYMDRIAVDIKGQRLFISGEHITHHL